MKTIALPLLLISAIANADSNHPDCSGIDRWATSLAYTQLKNQGMVSPDTIDYPKTKTVRLASEQVGQDLYRQIHHVVFTLKDGKQIEVITSNKASHEECSMSGVDIYVISKKL